MSASVRVQRLRPLGHINPGAIDWRIRLGNHKMVGVGQLETGKMQADGYQYFSSIYRAVCGIEFP